MKTFIAFFKLFAVLIFMICMLVPATLPAQNPRHLSVPDASGEYCIPFSDCSYGDGFENFAIHDIDNYFSGCSNEGYGDFTWMWTELQAGQSYSLFAETDYDGNYFCVWIDYNDDFEFTPDELIVEDAYLEFGAQLYQVEVTIPEDALPGVHRMRAKAVFGDSATDPCADDLEGETEDYTVEIFGLTGTQDIGIVSIDIPDVIAPDPIYPKVTLQNFGTETFTQQLSIINGADYGTSAFVYDMLPGEVRQITFAEWNASIGTYTFHAYLSFEDDNVANNQFFKEVLVEIPDVEPPQNLVAALDGNTVILNWDAPAGKSLVGYHVYNNGIRIADSLTQTTYTDLCLASGAYAYTVTALYDVGESLPSEAAEVSIELCELTLLEEGFEGFSGELPLVVQAQNLGIDYWHCWSQGPGNEEDPHLAFSPVYEGDLSLKIEGLNDVYIDLGAISEGKYDVNFQIYVPAGFDGFFGIWKEVYESAGMEIYFNEDGTGYAIIANSNWQIFSFNADEWIDVSLLVDLENDWAKLYINAEMICQAQWSLQQSGEPGLLMLDAIDFYAGTLYGGTPQSFVDAIEIKRIIDEPLPPESPNILVDENAVLLTWDAPMTGPLGYQIVRNSEILSTTSNLFFQDDNLDPGAYTYEITALYADCAAASSSPLEATIYPFQTIDIPAGWSGISGYLTPEDPNVVSLFEGVVEDLIILQSETGIYWPGANLNTLVNWNTQSGYKIKMTEGAELTLRGPAVENQTLMLSTGWNCIPVLSKYDVEVADLFAGLDVILIKEIAGNKIYWPEYDIHSLEFLLSGKSYFVMMESSGSIDFPEYDLTSSMKPGHCVGTPSPLGEGWGEVGQCGGSPFPLKRGTWLVAKTPITHTIAIPSTVVNASLIGSGLGAFDAEGHCFGLTNISQKSGALVIYGNDPTTPQKDGFTEGETIIFKIRTSESEDFEEVEISFDSNLPVKDAEFTTNGISAINSLQLKTNGFDENQQLTFEMYPNPAKDFVNINLTGGSGCEMEITISDLKGKQIRSIHFPGEKIRLNISDLEKGIYILKLSNGQQTHIEKLIIK